VLHRSRSSSQNIPDVGLKTARQRGDAHFDDDGRDLKLRVLPKKARALSNSVDRAREYAS
jgi:hypothetical protein